MKATYGEVKNCQSGCGKMSGPKECINRCIEMREIFKDPITDDGTKKSAKGLLSVNPSPKEDGTIVCRDQCTWDQERNSLLRTVFKDGLLIQNITLESIRNKLHNTIK